MRITQISLTNFRSFRATQNIDIAPVTLLFGPNSVGKSSILLALFYVQQILKHGHCDPLRIDALGNKHVGGFRSLVNGRDLSKRITLKITYKKSSFMGASYSKISELFEQDLGLTVDSPSADADEIAVEFSIAWSKQQATAYIANYKVWMDGQLIAELSSASNSKQPMIEYLNYEHPALLCDADEDFATESMAYDYISKFHEVLNGSRQTSLGKSLHSKELNRLDHEPLGFRGFVGALPKLGQQLETALEIDDPILSQRVTEILSDVVVAPLDNLLRLLDESLCIGPLRLIPDARYQKNPYPSQGDWYSGAAAWDELGGYGMHSEGINFWLSKESTLNLGYSLRTKTSKTRSVYYGSDDSISDLNALLDTFGDNLKISLSKEEIQKNPDAEQLEIDIEELREILANEVLPENSECSEAKTNEDISVDEVLWDDVNNIEVNSSDIGVGVSQLLPVIVAALRPSTRLVACEQPELHVHPRVQVGIGDLLLQTSKDRNFLIETHSEHLILRILRRIRETSEGELPDGVHPAYPKDISIVYLEPGPGGVKSRKIEVSEDGEFVQRWPHGFFTERGEELF